MDESNQIELSLLDVGRIDMELGELLVHFSVWWISIVLTFNFSRSCNKAFGYFQASELVSYR